MLNSDQANNNSTNKTHLTFSSPKLITNYPINNNLCKEANQKAEQKKGAEHDINSNKVVDGCTPKTITAVNPYQYRTVKPEMMYENLRFLRDTKSQNRTRLRNNSDMKDFSDISDHNSSEGNSNKLPGICTANKILYYLVSMIRHPHKEIIGSDLTNNQQTDTEETESVSSVLSETGECVDNFSDSTEAISCDKSEHHSKAGTFLIVRGNHKRYVTAKQLRSTEVDVFDPAHNEDVCNNHFKSCDDKTRDLKQNCNHEFKQRTCRQKKEHSKERLKRLEDVLEEVENMLSDSMVPDSSSDDGSLEHEDKATAEKYERLMKIIKHYIHTKQNKKNHLESHMESPSERSFLHHTSLKEKSSFSKSVKFFEPKFKNKYSVNTSERYTKHVTLEKRLSKTLLCSYDSALHHMNQNLTAHLASDKMMMRKKHKLDESKAEAKHGIYYVVDSSE